MEPQAIQPLLALEQQLLAVIAQLDPADPDCASLVDAHALLVSVLDDAAIRAGDVLAEVQHLMEREPPILGR